MPQSVQLEQQKTKLPTLEAELETRRAKQKDSGFIGVDLDGTLAEYHGWMAWNHIGPPIPVMAARVKKFLDEGYTVKIMTARLPFNQNLSYKSTCWQTGQVYTRGEMRRVIGAWCFEHLGVCLEVVNVKCADMIELWDDRAIQVVTNTGQTLAEVHVAELTALKGAP